MSFSRNSRPKRRSDAMIDPHYGNRVVGSLPSKRKRLSFPSSGSWSGATCHLDNPYAPQNVAFLANSNENWLFPDQISTEAISDAKNNCSVHVKSVDQDKDRDRDQDQDPLFMTRDEIERRSPSRKDGIDATRETRLRYSYCAFLQNLGLRLELPQMTTGTAMVLCHRFFARRSHACHDRYLIATAALFLAAKSEETPRPLNNVLTVACEICHQQNLSFLPQFLPLDWFVQYRERVLEAENIILTTLNFELNVQHPYTSLVAALKKLGLSQTALVNLAWSLISEGHLWNRLSVNICFHGKSMTLCIRIVPICARPGDIVAWGMMCCSCKAFFLTSEVEKLVCSGNIQMHETHLDILHHGFSLSTKIKFPRRLPGLRLLNFCDLK